jgi:hypothetical protein
VIKGLASHSRATKAKQADIIEALVKLRDLSKTRNDIIHAEFKIVFDPNARSKSWNLMKTFLDQNESSLYLARISQRVDGF